MLPLTWRWRSTAAKVLLAHERRWVVRCGRAAVPLCALPWVEQMNGWQLLVLDAVIFVVVFFAVYKWMSRG